MRRAAERRDPARGGISYGKFPAVQAAERGHMYYSDPGNNPKRSCSTTPIHSISWVRSAPRG